MTLKIGSIEGCYGAVKQFAHFNCSVGIDTTIYAHAKCYGIRSTNGYDISCMPMLRNSNAVWYSRAVATAVSLNMVCVKYVGP